MLARSLLERQEGVSLCRIGDRPGPSYRPLASSPAECPDSALVEHDFIATLCCGDYERLDICSKTMQPDLKEITAYKRKDTWQLSSVYQRFWNACIVCMEEVERVGSLTTIISSLQQSGGESPSVTTLDVGRCGLTCARSPYGTTSPSITDGVQG